MEMRLDVLLLLLAAGAVTLVPRILPLLVFSKLQIPLGFKMVKLHTNCNISSTFSTSFIYARDDAVGLSYCSNSNISCSDIYS